nr:hypothetical protein Iba_chr12bCG16270 [Ipomoea batatas]
METQSLPIFFYPFSKSDAKRRTKKCSGERGENHRSKRPWARKNYSEDKDEDESNYMGLYCHANELSTFKNRSREGKGHSCRICHGKKGSSEIKGKEVIFHEEDEEREKKKKENCTAYLSRKKAARIPAASTGKNFIPQFNTSRKRSYRCG